MLLADNEAYAAICPKHFTCEPGTVLELFERQCERTPHAVAVVSNEEQLTYADLANLSNQLAIYLAARSVVPGQLIGICLQRSPRMLVGLLGILKSGAAYVPVDPQYPEQRMRFVLQDCRANLVVTEEAAAESPRRTDAQLVYLDSDWDAIIAATGPRPRVLEGPNRLAYVLYTSGTTGKPKGVAVSHGSLTNLLLSMAREPGLTSSDVFLAVSTLCFDISALELYLPLIVGARVVIATGVEARDPQGIMRLIQKHEITATQATPATWRMLLASGWKGQRNLKALCGGEALPRDLANSVLDRVGSLWNMYGPTETTIWSTVERVRKEPGPVTIGRPIANTSIHILDEQGTPTPIDVPGELYIGGAGLADGYVNQPDLTAERFVVQAVNGVPQRLYRTGDYARYLPDGRVEFLGRKDTQVKIRGHRIELGEIESVLRQHPSVLDSVAVVREMNGGELQLSAYVVSHQPRRALNIEELKSHVRSFLPDYMVPSFFILLKTLPLTPSGKVDRVALARASVETPALESYLPPRDDVERQLTEIFESVLNVHPVGITADFFALGGHSLLAVVLFSRIGDAFGRILPLGTIFEAPTVERLAEVLNKGNTGSLASPLVRIQAGGSLPPFFCVHSQGASIMTYRPLAELLGSDQPFYGLQPRGLDGNSAPHTRIEDLAADYIQELRTVQPAGPYYLGGVCLGGIIALEMAQQLHDAGEDAGLVVLIDSHFPGSPKHLPRRGLDQSLLWSLDRHIGRLLLCPPLAALKLEINWLRELLARALGRRKLPGVLARVIEANRLAERSYVPRPYAGRLILFWCGEWSFRAYQDRRLSWSEIAEQGLEVHAIPGDHRSMLEPPNVKFLAEKLGRRLQKSREEMGTKPRLIRKEVSFDQVSPGSLLS